MPTYCCIGILFRKTYCHEFATMTDGPSAWRHGEKNRPSPGGSRFVNRYWMGVAIRI